MTLNGNVKEYAMKAAFGLVATAMVGAWGFLMRIDNRVTEMEALQRVRTEQLQTIREDIAEIKDSIKDIPRGEGGMTERERREFRQMAEDLRCVRGMLSGQRSCPPS